MTLTPSLSTVNDSTHSTQVATNPGPGIIWADSAREQAFHAWLNSVAPSAELDPGSLRLASADASFRRYFRINTSAGDTRVIMDAPPEYENAQSFVDIARLLEAAGLNVPKILEWDAQHGFLLLTDLGQKTMLEGMDMSDFTKNATWYREANSILVQMQTASSPGKLPPYNEALLRRELQLFPDWYLAQHKAYPLSAEQATTLQHTFDQIIARNLAAPCVYVHRDFMPRNLMLGQNGLGVLDFQDACYGPITYDIASLMRDAFHSWDEEYVLDVSVRYWEQARKTGLMDFEDWHSDFASFYRAVDWMALQRHLKVAGIFARLTLRDGKAKYLEDAPRFIAYLRATASRYRELSPLLRLLDTIEGNSAPSGYAFGRVA